MTNEEIVNSAKEHEKSIGFGELAKSELSRGVNSAYGIGFLDGAEWALSQPQIIEIFGKRVKMVNDGHDAYFCEECALFEECRKCATKYHVCAKCVTFINGVKTYIENRHFVEVDEDGNEIGGNK